MNDTKIRVKRTRRYGRGVFAARDLRKGEVVASFDGEIYDDEFDGWTDEILNHTIQFGPAIWRDSNGPARYLNHSCEPNCGIRGVFKIVTMRAVEKGEELTWDYEMTERNRWGWRMKCRCGSALCRKSIGSYSNMPKAIRAKYKGYISTWLEPRKATR